MLCQFLLIPILLIVSVQSQGTCVDKVNSCSRAASYCNRPALQATLRQNCARTCNFCAPTAPANKPRSRPKPKTKPNSSPAAKYPTYKLHYFTIRSRAEPIRLMFNYKKVKFEDFRIKSEDWPKLKDTYPNGQLPVLEVDGKTMISQSNTIYRYVGNKLCLVGKDDLETAMLDSLGELHRDLFEGSLDYIDAKLGISTKTADELNELLEKFNAVLERVGSRLVEALKKQSSGFLGSKLSWVDFFVADSTFTFRGVAEESMKKYPELIRHQEKVYGLPELKQYIASRPENKL